MRVYSTYQEAKIANPSEDIFMYGNMYKSGDAPCKPSEWWKKCNPTDHCMTVEKFLVDGNELTEGDVIINANGNVNVITSVDCKALNLGGYSIFNDGRFILRAAALETKEQKRTKVEYEQLGFHKCHEAMFKHEMEEKLYRTSHDGFVIASMNDIADNWQSELYRRIETPIEWWEDANDLLGELANLSLDDDGVLQLTMERGQVGFGMSRDKWCDFARILLEQGE